MFHDILAQHAAIFADHRPAAAHDPRNVAMRRYDFYAGFKTTGRKKMQTVWAFNLEQAVHSFLNNYWLQHKPAAPSRHQWSVKEFSDRWVFRDRNGVERKTRWHAGPGLLRFWVDSISLNINL